MSKELHPEKIKVRGPLFGDRTITLEIASYLKIIEDLLPVKLFERYGEKRITDVERAVTFHNSGKGLKFTVSDTGYVEGEEIMVDNRRTRWKSLIGVYNLTKGDLDVLKRRS
tara:strand:+ start:1145 stop:1480 length:336 start_codon:yes stop_codon:yes gene_type:complete